MHAFKSGIVQKHTTLWVKKSVGALDMAAHRSLHLKYDVSKITMDSPKGVLLTKMTNSALLTSENKDILFLEPVS